MLRHVGVTRRQILSMLALEGGLLTALGMLVGFLLGWAISLILVFIVNPQSFHWTMELQHAMARTGGGWRCLLLLSAGATALAGRDCARVSCRCAAFGNGRIGDVFFAAAGFGY